MGISVSRQMMGFLNDIRPRRKREPATASTAALIQNEPPAGREAAGGFLKLDDGNYFSGCTFGVPGWLGMAGTSPVTGGAASISLNFGSARRRGAADSPVQQQETEMRATADAQRARRGRIMGQTMVGKLQMGEG